MRIPPKEVLISAVDKTLPDIVAPHLKVLFCGINPGLYSAYTGRHFARPGNRFWPALYRSGLVDRPLAPADQYEMLSHGYGLTNIVPRASAAADELSPAEIIADAQRLVEKVDRLKPQVLAVLGVSVYRVAFNQPRAAVGLQPELIGPAHAWVLPSPSGLNAHYSSQRILQAFVELRQFVESLPAQTPSGQLGS